VRAFEHRDVSRESDGERRKQDVHCDHPRELHSRQEEGIHGMHRAVESRDGNVKCDSSELREGDARPPCDHPNLSTFSRSCQALYKSLIRSTPQSSNRADQALPLG